MKKKEVLVTGATGFIGTHAVYALLKEGYRVHALVRDSKRPWGKRVTYHKVDLRKGLSPTLLKNISSIVHLAGQIDINGSIKAPKERLLDNFLMTSAVLEAIREIGTKPLVVFASTDRVYGKTKLRTVTETEHPFPIEPYTASKIIGETELALYAHLYDIPYIALRFDSVYGPGQPSSMFISDVIKKMLASNQIETGPLTTVKNFVYVGDVADAIVRAVRARHSAHNRAYNIGGARKSLRDVVGELTHIMKKTGRTITVQEAKVSSRPGKAEVHPFTLSTKAAQKHLGWRPKTALYNGLIKTIEYFAS